MNIAMYVNDILSCRSGVYNFSLYKKALFILKKTLDNILVLSFYGLSLGHSCYLGSFNSEIKCSYECSSITKN